jgi:hypothetical protein
VGRATDSVGRRGTAVAFVHDGVEHELIFDPASSDMLAERSIVLNGAAKRLGLRPGSVISSTTDLQRAVTDTQPSPERERRSALPPFPRGGDRGVASRPRSR